MKKKRRGTEVQTKEKRIGVRRKIGSSNEWGVVSPNRVIFTSVWKHILLADVHFVHQAKPMECEPGYESTGEAIGVLVAASNKASDVLLPKEASTILRISYDRQTRRFHLTKKLEQIIDTADYLLLRPDGTAIAAWKRFE